MSKYLAALSAALPLFWPVQSAGQATPDEIANATFEQFELGETGTVDSEDRTSEFLRLEMLVKQERLSRSGNLILRKEKEATGLGYFHEYWIIEERKLDNGVTMAYIRPLSDAERNELIVAHGTTTEKLGRALEQSATSIAIFGAALDSEIQKSGVAPGLLDGANGSAMLGMMLSPQSRSKDGKSGCEQMLGEDGSEITGKSYSDTYAIGVNPSTDKFSFSTFLAGGACMFQEVGHYVRTGADDSDDLEKSLTFAMIKTANAAASWFKWHGLEGPANDRQAHISMSDVGLTEETSDGGSVTINEIHAWIDADAYVRTKTRFVGVMQTDGQSQDFFMETEWSDFEHVPGTALYEPMREDMRVGGMISDADRAQMAEAEKELAAFEQQLASMPASQRKMMESMVGPQIEQYRSLVNGGAVEISAVTTAIIVNPQMVDPDNTIVAGVERDQADRLIRRIQQDLETLGYDPGVLNGDLTSQTVTAISQFEASMGMDVTGEATPQLADVLAAEVDKRM